MKASKARDLMSSPVLFARADWPLYQLAEFFIEHHFSGAPVLSDKNEVLGVVTLSDLVRHEMLPLKEPAEHHNSERLKQRLAEEYDEEDLNAIRMAENTATTVADIMTPTIFSVSEDDDLRSVAAMMCKGQVHRLFVKRDTQIVGVVAALDLLRCFEDD